VSQPPLKPEIVRIGTGFARLIREGPWPVNATAAARFGAQNPHVTKAHKAVRSGRAARRLVYIARMRSAPPATARPRGLTRRLLPLAVVVVLIAVAYYTLGRGGISLEALVRHRMAIDEFVSDHRLLAVLAYVGLYIAAVALSVPGAVFLTAAGGFLFGLAIGVPAAVIGATIGATLIFLIARSALGEPLLRRAGPRAAQLAKGFRDDAFNYLLFLRLVPAFPFFLVNLVPAFAGVRLGTFVAATALGIIPATVVFALAGTGLDSIIMVQKNAYQACLAAGHSACSLTFDAADALTPRLLGALVALGLLALIPVIVKRLRARRRASP
jgi:uncharacterized membrane protein YdjX (TVP38/TMEM64 family)